MKALSWSLAVAALVIIPLLVGTWVKSSNAKEEEPIMDFTPKNRAQVVIDDYGIKVIGFCWQDRPFLVALKTGMGGDGLQLLKVEGWCQ
jgi:hypothetical protein